MKNACEGVMYPIGAKEILIKDFSTKELSSTKKFYSNSLLDNTLHSVYVPHKAWLFCKNELDEIFLSLQSQVFKDTVKRIFVLAPLHKGSIIGEPVVVYTPSSTALKGSDWEIQLELPKEFNELECIQKNDDVCTEEHSLEVVSPYLDLFYPNAAVTYFLAPKEISKENIRRILTRIAFYSNESLIFISDNKETHCASMWLK